MADSNARILHESLPLYAVSLWVWFFAIRIPLLLDEGWAKVFTLLGVLVLWFVAMILYLRICRGRSDRWLRNSCWLWVGGSVLLLAVFIAEYLGALPELPVRAWQTYWG